LINKNNNLGLIHDTSAIILASIFATIAPEIAQSFAVLGQLFVNALKAVAPVLIFVLVMSSIANQKLNSDANLKPIIFLYFIGTLSAACVAVVLSFLFPTTLTLDIVGASANPPQGLGEVLTTLAFKVVENPVTAITNGNFIAVLAWGIGLGLALKHSNESTKAMVHDFSEAITGIVRFVIRLAPIGIFGLVANTIASTGFSVFSEYAQLLTVLVGSMLIIALIVNPLIVYMVTKKNPYPLVFTCLKESGITAFFTRSSAANVPINLALCKKLDLHEDTYSISIPLGSAINMAGAAITVTVLTLATANSLDIVIDLPTALLLCVVASISACGSSGVAGGQ